MILMVHVGYTENQVNEMYYPTFHRVLGQLGRKLNYEAVVNYAGNSFMQKSWEMIEKANPLTPIQERGSTSAAMQNLVALLGGANMVEG